MSNTSKSSCIAVQVSITSDPSNTSHNPSNATSSTEAEHLSTRRVQRYLADNNSPVPYILPTIPADGNLDRSSTAVHTMSGKLQQFDAIFYLNDKLEDEALESVMFIRSAFVSFQLEKRF
ncbi:uncharacterized protein Bfra_003053 [Botrytis fragariae]|uniref:Uncharacterized protein n=1 Tax=Botrytis fragariae TaxID=1964551 RepID=A0A8H6ELI0_9HELO|nr:uncharacterized protein Bfra_003053 [Botrytis fragariae]KAF5876647.1 hypothetical protein Bfra_003053 [Botrytis fragariae]